MKRDDVAAAPRLEQPASKKSKGETFFRAKERHRRASLLLSAMTLAGLVMMSAPIASLLFPFCFLVAAAASNLLSLVAPTPDLGAMMGDRLDQLLSFGGWRNISAAALVFLFPGVLVIALFYHRALRLLRQDGGAAFLHYLGARALNKSDAEERQLFNLIEEMSIAAGERAPLLYLTDARGVNAGAFRLGGGQRPFVVFARELLDRFDRTETAALAGHVVALGSIRDDAAGVRLVAALIAIDMSGSLIAAPFDANSRARIWRFATSKPAVAELLDAPAVDQLDLPSKGWRVYAALPFTLAHATFHLVRMLSGLLFFSPALGFMLRRRRLLADAVAIELTREPQALAHALAHLAAPDTAAAPAANFPANFAIAARGESALAQAIATLVRPHPPVDARIAQLRRMGAVQGATAGNRSQPPVIVVILYGVVALLGAALVPLMIFVMAALTALSLGIGLAAAFAVANLTGLVRP